MTDLAVDVLIVGAGGAGMYAALSAASAGAERVLLVDKSFVGRGGATVMAQMTVAAALGEETPDEWSAHLDDTLAAGRGLCDGRLAALLCRDAPVRIREMGEWGTDWARRDNGRIAQVTAPGHSRPRCCYVDFLNTGPAVAATLRRQISRVGAIRRVSNLTVIDLVTAGGEVVGAVALDWEKGEAVTIAAKAVIIATGGLTRIFQRNSASANMGGDGYSLALGAGAELVDMEFVQFFPIGHLAPRLVGLDPIMWDPFRYKLGGRLLDGAGREFLADYGSDESAGYTTPRDLATYAINTEVAAGRGSPHGGVYLSFTHIPKPVLEAAFGPVIDRLAENGIDLGRMPVEVAPIAHYHMGGIAVDDAMVSTVPGLYAAGEAAGGANGANRLSGNAIPEALVFGAVAGRSAATFAAARKPNDWSRHLAAPAIERVRALADGRVGLSSAAVALEELREIMWRDAGPFRDASGLTGALARIGELQTALAEFAVAPGRRANPTLADWFELRASLGAAEAVVRAALARQESRGAHQRTDFPDTDPAWARNQRIRMTAAGAVAVV
ncbi:MAG TPA: FAD-binding protein [Stellaceae bacterium]|jgi:succinate dehydrogenase/fumarate reductase flavoprotein subunit|nr:FAD-binding protein [Stellaceae bacterium]